MTAKVKVIDPRGLVHEGKNHPEGTELELSGPFLEAARRFKQVEDVKEKKEKEPDSEKKK